MTEFFGTISKLLLFLSSAEKKSFVGLIVLQTLVALVDVLGIASIAPFVAVLSDPSYGQKIINVLDHLDISFSSSQITGYVALVGFGMFSLAIVLKAVLFFCQTKFIFEVEAGVGVRILEGYTRNLDEIMSGESAPSEIAKNVLSEVGAIINSGIHPLVMLSCYSTMIIIIVGFLIYFDPALTLTAFGIFGGSYIVVFLFVKRRLREVAESKVESNQFRYEDVFNVVAGYEYLSSRGKVSEFVDKFRHSALRFGKAQAASIYFGNLPRFAIEFVAFGGMFILLYLLSLNHSGDHPVLATAAVFAAAGYRLLPAAQQIYQAICGLGYVRPVIAVVERLLKSEGSSCWYGQSRTSSGSVLLTLDNVEYYYSRSGSAVFSGLNLAISEGERIAILGASGSGKSTLLRIMLGLVGGLNAGSVSLSPQISRERGDLSYVPQDSVLFAGTILENVTMGDVLSGDDYIWLDRCLEIAELAALIKSLPDGLNYHVGHDGMALSGGQRQRVAIARALFCGPRVLIFDEFNSALDGATSEKILVNLCGAPELERCAMVFVTHRMDVLKYSTKVLRLASGTINAEAFSDDG